MIRDTPLTHYLNRITMKNCIFFCFFLLASFFLSCMNSKNNERAISNCDSLLKGKEIIEESITVYEVNKEIHAFLDSIILYEEECAYYNKCVSGFSFTVQQENESLKIEINSANIYSHDYSNCFGVFEYGSYLFICEGLNIEKILNRTKLKKKIKYINIDRSQWEISHDDRFSTWYFELKNDIIHLTGHHPCPKRNIPDNNI